MGASLRGQTRQACGGHPSLLTPDVSASAKRGLLWGLVGGVAAHQTLIGMPFSPARGVEVGVEGVTPDSEYAP